MPSLLQKTIPSLLGRRLALRLVAATNATLHGSTHVPKDGPALIVGNHTLLAADTLVLTALLLLETGRVPRFLAERNLFRLPGLRAAVHAFGAIPGEPDSAQALLEGGELVCVYPGGVDESFKTSSEAYQLLWKERSGFARVAMRAQAPIVPVAATGIDELWDVIAREPLLGRTLLGSTRYDLPIVRSPLPRRVPLSYHVQPQVDTSGDPTSRDDVERVRLATWTALESVLAPYRAARA